MARKRANGEGSISKEASGRYRISVSVKVGSKLKRITRTAWKHADAVAILQKLRSDSEITLIRSPQRFTIEAYLKSWLRDVVCERAANTQESYRIACESHIIPHVGTVMLKVFEPVHIQHFMAEMARAEVGSRTRQNAFTVLRAAIRHAFKLRLIASDPFAHAEKPAHVPEEINPFTLDESKLILSSTIGSRYHAVMQLGITAGIRQGEMFGLEWDRVDIAARRIFINQQAVEISGRITLAVPKTKASIRTIDITKQAAAALTSHKAILLAEGNAGSKFVFPAPEGGIQGRGNFRTRVWNPLLLSLAIESRGFHHTRHTYATLSLGAGIPITVVSKQLGHSKVSTTLDIYSHVLDTHQTAATETLSRLFG